MNKPTLPEGWTVTKKFVRPFGNQYVLITPTKKVAVVNCVSSNPENILFELCEGLEIPLDNPTEVL